MKVRSSSFVLVQIMKMSLARSTLRTDKQTNVTIHIPTTEGGREERPWERG